MTSRCKQCGEQITKTGNYTFKILPAKRIPKKARKLIKTGELANEHEQSSSTKFSKFLAKRSTPANFMELTCGKCGGVSQIKMLKTRFGTNKESPLKSEGKMEVDLTKERISSGARRKKAKKKDKTAGLNIVTPSPVLTEQKSSKESQPKASSSANQRKPVASKAQVQSKKDLEKLKKMLFQSKKGKKSGSTLQDFLSSI